MKRRLASSTSHPIIRIWKSRGFVVLLVLLVILTSVSVTRELLRRMETMRAVQEFSKEIGRLEQRNSQMRDVIGLFATDKYQEKQARVKLSLQKEGEHLVIFPHTLTPGEIILPGSDVALPIITENQSTNPEKWLQFFREKMKRYN